MEGSSYMKRVFVISALIMTVTTASALEIDESGGYYCEGEDTCGAGWIWNTEAKECVKAPIS
tara:strand:- start:51 stop:236 length:186 start_codon:yes stop_codon:yes gene_type:complete